MDSTFCFKLEIVDTNYVKAEKRIEQNVCWINLTISCINIIYQDKIRVLHVLISDKI